MYVRSDNMRMLGFDDFIEVIFSLAALPWVYALSARKPDFSTRELQNQVERALGIIGPVLDAVVAAKNKPKVEKALWPMALLAGSIAPRFNLGPEGKFNPTASDVQEHVETGVRLFQAIFDYMRGREKTQ